MAGAQLIQARPSPWEEPAAAPRLTRWTRFAYGVGDISNAVKTVMAALFGFFFYTSVMGLPGSLVGLAGAIGLVWDALIDPYIGQLSDHSRARRGRRHAFMLAGALTMGAGFWLSFSPPRGLPQPVLFAWLLGTGFLLRTATSVFRVPYFALGAELSRDYDERTSIVGLRGDPRHRRQPGRRPPVLRPVFSQRGRGRPEAALRRLPAAGASSSAR